MNKLLRYLSLSSVCGFAAAGLGAAEPQPVYELRIYTTHPGKMPALLARFREHTCAIFARLGMENVGYWLPLDTSESNRLYYVLKHASREAAKASWETFNADPEWIAARNASEAAGPIVAKVESTFMTITDFSPAPPALTGAHVFELRIYQTNAGKLVALDARFRDHTMTLFARHGLTNVIYWHPTDADKGAGKTLIYLLAHPSRDTAKKSWDAFHADPEWIAARTESEKNGPLLDGTPRSIFLAPTDFSPMK